MKTLRHIQWAAVALAVVMMVGPYPVYAAARQATPRNQTTISDIRLAGGGLLEGRLVDSQASPIEGASVAILHDGLEVARTSTDANGGFQVAGLRGGVHQISGPSGTATCRLWQQGMAPPSARESAVVITRGPLVRGQQNACSTGCPTNCNSAGCPTNCNSAGCPTNCNSGCRTVCQTICPADCQPRQAQQIAVQQAVANSPQRRAAVQPLAVGLPAANSTGRQVQYQEAVPQVPQTVQGPPAGPYAQPPMGTGFETWGWNPRVRDILIACGIAAAIAIPIAIANSGSSS